MVINDVDSKINIQYKFTEQNDEFEFYLYSEDAFGTENTLSIDATLDELHKWDDSVGDYVSSEFYWFSNIMNSKKICCLTIMECK